MRPFIDDGIQPFEMSSIIGKKVIRFIEGNEIIKWKDIESEKGDIR